MAALQSDCHVCPAMREYQQQGTVHNNLRLKKHLSDAQSPRTLPASDQWHSMKTLATGHAGDMQDGAAEIVPRQPTGQEAPAPRPLDGLKYAAIGYPRNDVRTAALHVPPAQHAAH